MTWYLQAPRKALCTLRVYLIDFAELCAGSEERCPSAKWQNETIKGIKIVWRERVKLLECVWDTFLQYIYTLSLAGGIS